MPHALFIHGAWMTPASWDKMRSVFDPAGFTTEAPAWPHLDKSVAELRAGENRELGRMPLRDIVGHYGSIIRAMRDPPVLIGHSFGGLVVQLLLDQGFGSAGVAIDPAPIAGVIPGPVSLAAALPVVLRLDGWNRPFTISRDAFAKTFANTVPDAERNRFYDELVVPTSGRIFYEAATMIGTSVKTRERKQPLLIVVGEKDRTVTPYLARAAYDLQKRAPARTDFHEFPGRSHFLIAEPGWEEVANYVLNWVKSL